MIHLSSRQEVEQWFKAQRAADEDLDDSSLDAVYPCNPDDWVINKTGDNNDAPLSGPNAQPDLETTSSEEAKEGEEGQGMKELSLSETGEDTIRDPW